MVACRLIRKTNDVLAANLQERHCFIFTLRVYSFTIYFVLFTTHYSLRIIHYAVLATHYSLFIIHYSLFIIILLLLRYDAEGFALEAVGKALGVATAIGIGIGAAVFGRGEL